MSIAKMKPATPKPKALSRISARLLQFVSDGLPDIYGERRCKMKNIGEMETKRGIGRAA